jgi:HD-GYP domain-containing protein (c-di-GMP phosphodiesterase class II)
MDFDSYRSPEAETLLRSERERFSQRSGPSRLLVTEAAGAVLFVALAVLLALDAPWPYPISVPRLVITVVPYLVASRVRFPVGSALSVPTQVVFVPMLFLLPAQIVPLIVATCLVLDLWPDIPHGRVTSTRVLTRIGDSFYALGPALVLVLAHRYVFAWDAWPILVLAFAAQVGFDAAAGLLRTWFAEGILPREQKQMLWLYATDLCLACAGLLSLPMIAMLGLFARERQQRVDYTLELSSAYRGTAQVLSDVIEADDEYTGLHSRQVVDLSLAVADTLGLGSAGRLNVEFGALLHDVGKIRVPTEIIRKPSKLDDTEWAIMRRHTIEGQAILEKVGGTLARVGVVVRASHERFDGAGYPDQLHGSQIPIESRIISACDAYNAMTTDRSYRPAMSAMAAVEELTRCAGTQFDPNVVAALVRALGPVTWPQAEAAHAAPAGR